MANHRFSGWPGAWCLDCGQPDWHEQALADNGLDIAFENGKPSYAFWLDEGREDQVRVLQICLEPDSKRFDPYARLNGTRFDYEGFKLGFVDQMETHSTDMRRSIHHSHRGEGRNFVG